MPTVAAYVAGVRTTQALQINNAGMMFRPRRAQLRSAIVRLRQASIELADTLEIDAVGRRQVGVLLARCEETASKLPLRNYHSDWNKVSVPLHESCRDDLGQISDELTLARAQRAHDVDATLQEWFELGREIADGELVYPNPIPRAQDGDIALKWSEQVSHDSALWSDIKNREPSKPLQLALLAEAWKKQASKLLSRSPREPLLDGDERWMLSDKDRLTELCQFLEVGYAVLFPAEAHAPYAKRLFKGVPFILSDGWYRIEAGIQQLRLRLMLPWSPEIDARNKWLYEQTFDVSQPLRRIPERLKEHTEWDPIDSLPGAMKAARRYAEVHRKDPPPKRGGGRPRKEPKRRSR